MVRIKICGITNLEDALLAIELGADALGFIFYPKSPRKVAPETAREIIAQLPPFVASVGVFVDEAATVVQELAARVGLDWVQLHGQESPDYCRNLGRKVIKAFRIQDEDSLRLLADYQGAAQALLLDTYKKGQVGGTGEIFDWHLARKAKKYGHIILAGGLTPDNVAMAIATALPMAVDAASGTEATPGKKDPAKLRAFFQAILHGPLDIP
ncbi:MAG: phosphoribosylanthranilate isomerase [Desulfobacterales bacterium]|nr:phosphoribosylanthranilate isomerase [Pseudomonadota bacterium]MBU4356389.1 phosphoribosylanthranilate isomerase [Pseudomonadota bacterium]MCG2773491.1 phosphoribosylanthranilate isomerase [Desulfobacterales bacterium]